MIRVWERDDGRLALDTPYGLLRQVQELPGRRWDRAATHWHLPPTPAAVEAVKRLADRNHLPIEGDARYEELLVAARQAWAARRAAATLDDGQLPDLPGITPAWHHQKRAFVFARDRMASMLAMDMGTGKTRTAIGLAEYWQVRCCVVLCPTSVMLVWPDQLEQHAERDWIAPEYHRSASVKARVQAMTEAVQYAAAVGQPVLLAVNYEATIYSPMDDFLLALEPDLLILDESHRIKAPGGVQSMYASRLARKSKRRLALTGTPMPHNPLDVYAQVRALDEGLFGTSYHAFQRRFAVMGGYENRQVVGLQREHELASRFGQIAFQCRAEDVLDLPDSRHVTIPLDLAPKAARAYRALADDLVADVEDGTVTAANALVRLLRLQQVTSGYLPLDDDQRLVELDTSKREALIDLFRDLPADEPITVMCRFRHDLEQVRLAAEATDRRYGELSGANRDGLVAGGRMGEHVDVLGVQIQSGGVGIDLTRARYQVYLSVGFSLGDFEQSLARVLRPGQKHDVTYYHLVCRNTIDEVVRAALRDRADVVRRVLDAARSHEL